MRNNIKNYLWFIKESQRFMVGYYSKNRVLNFLKVFVMSIYKGIGFCRDMNKEGMYWWV